MKRFLSSALIFVLLTVAIPSFAQENDATSENQLVETIGTADINHSESDESSKEESTGFPAISDKPFLIFNEGITYSQVTRLIYQDDYSRSNFVWQNHLIGLSLEAQTVNIKPVDSILRLGLYYPFYYTFNGMKQPPKQAILYAVDLFWGPIFQADMWKYVYINFALGPHFLYQLSDEYHHVELGGGVLLGVEFPLARRWTILVNGLASLDYGNFGSNRDIQPYNLVYNYQLELGVRYSKKKPHQYSYLSK